MTPDEAFLQTIIESPEDDAPRLVYADWLEDHGDPGRAEFIRLQCQLARTPRHPKRQQLRRREKELLKEHEADWLGPVRGALRTWEFRRGFLHEVSLTAADLFKHTRTLLSRHPVRQLTLFDVGRKEAAELAALPQLAGMRTLIMGGGSKAMGPAGASALARSPHLANLTELYLAGQNIKSAGAKALAGSPHLARLSLLLLSRNEIDPAGVEALVSSPHLAALATLDLSGNRLCDAGARALAGPSRLASLRHLELTGCGIGDAGTAALAGSPHLAKLRTLDLSFNRVGTRGARALAESPHLPRLSALKLPYNNLRDRSAREELLRRFGKRVLLAEA